MADDAGALLVRSGLVSPNALDDARARVASVGGTLGEQLVTSGAIADDDLTDFYRSRLLVPQVNPNMLARLTPKVVATIPSDMAIELRAIPVSLDGDNNLTVAMSDPSDRHAVDEIAFFTGAYVVRAVATQMQIAWCLAHYYGHVTALGQRLLRVAQSEPVKPSSSPGRRPPRAKGLTGKVNATRHRAVAPITGPLDVLRPSSGQLDLRPLERAAAGAPSALGSGQGPAVQPPTGAGATSVIGLAEPALAEPRAAGFAPTSAGPAEPADLPAPLTVPGFVRPNPLMASAAPGNAIPKPMEMVESGALPMVVLPVVGAKPSDDTATVGRPAARHDARHDAGNRPTKPGVGPSPGGPDARGGARPASEAAALRAPAAAPPAAPPTAAPRPSPAAPPTAAPRPSPAPPAAAPPAAAPPTAAPRPSPGPPAAAPPTAAPPPAAPRPSPAPPAAAPPAAAPPAAAPPAAAPPTQPAAAAPATPPPAAAGAPRSPAPAAGSDAPASIGNGAPTEPIEDGARVRMASSPESFDANDGGPEKPRARSISGEIRVPVRRAPSVRPPPEPEADDEDEPLIMIEMREEDDELAPRPLPVRRRPIVKSDPPELYARAGEVDLKAGDDHAIDGDEPRIVVDEDALAPPTGRIAVRAAAPPITAIDVVEDADTAAVIHDRVVDRAPEPGAPAQLSDDDDSDTGEIDVVVLDAPKKPRPERRTRLGVPPAVNARRAREVDPTAMIGDATTVDLHPAPPGEDTTSDQLAAPPAPVSDADTNPHLVAPPPRPAPPAPRTGAFPQAVIVDESEDDDEDDDEPRGPRTSEMTAAELDAAIPERTGDVVPDLVRRGVEHDAIDDGWGPPGTTIPPPLLGAIPGSDDDEDTAGGSAIPMPNVDSSPLLVAPPVASAGDPGGRALVRALEEATARAIEVIHQLERTQSRDQIVQVMVSHLAETHHRAGFFVTKHAVARDAGELALFAMAPRPAVMPSATLRLDRPSTLQDVVGTRLPYRGPMHDDASRAFLISVLGACPPEILLVPVTVRERVVGVLFGEHRQRHTFDDQLALAARAAGMAFERILRSRRG